MPNQTDHDLLITMQVDLKFLRTEVERLAVEVAKLTAGPRIPKQVWNAVAAALLALAGWLGASAYHATGADAVTPPPQTRTP